MFSALLNKCIVTLYSMSPYPMVDMDPSGEAVQEINTSNFFMDGLRALGYTVLKGLAYMVDGVYDAIQELLSFSFIDDIPALAGMSDIFSDTAWAVISLFICIGAILLMINHDKLRLTDFAKSVIVSGMLIIGFPTLISSFDAMKDAGVADANDMLLGTSVDSVGEGILASVIVDVAETIDYGEVTYLDPAVKNPYMIRGGDHLSEQEYTHKVEFYSEYTHQSFAEAASWVVYGMSVDEQCTLLGNASAYRYGWADLDSMYSPEQVASIIKGRKSGNVGYEDEDIDTGIRALLDKLDEEPVPVDIVGEEVIMGPLDDTEAMLKIKESDEAKAIQYLDELRNEYLDYISWIEAQYSNQPNYAYVPLANGEYSIGTIDFLKEYIYSYNFDFITGYLLLGITLVALIFAGFKIASLMFDLVFNQIIAPVVFASDIGGAGRAKKMIQHMLGTFLVMIIILILIKIFLEIVGFICTWEAAGGSNVTTVLVRIFVIGGCAKGLIDGPDLVVQILGLDAGVKSGMGAIAGAAAVASTAKSGFNAVKGVAHGVGSVVKAPGKAVDAVMNHNPSAGMKRMINERNNRNEQFAANQIKKASGGESYSPSSSSPTNVDDGYSYNSNNIFAGRDLTPPASSINSQAKAEANASVGSGFSVTRANAVANAEINSSSSMARGNLGSSTGPSINSYSDARIHYESPSSGGKSGGVEYSTTQTKTFDMASTPSIKPSSDMSLPTGNADKPSSAPKTPMKKEVP